ncbi:hypothetical protein CY34DRAFT_108007 [Suillus luteus UH-Slu-Lm8-n1]|uniref:Uncharacterized protein n=1 Tax=Suillus luteus UH-Slu-Lm8-n1 TaxID=930992 RepID=A0A0C9ZQC9_9AGAM|nr:hypothetical protein CY34DRAFT_108007 [Suillus luteus UH-Slu-Lm8-n1]
MSSHSTSVPATATANQALIAFVTQLTAMVQDVIRLPSQEEKMELSWNIACEVNDTIRSYGKEASYVPPGLLKTLSATPPIASAASVTAPVSTPAPPPASTPAPPPAPTPAPAPPPAYAPASDASIHMPQCAASGENAPVGSLTIQKHRHSISPPLPHANWSWKPVIKSKEFLSDMDTTDTGKMKRKGKAPEVDGDEDDNVINVNGRPDVEPQKLTRKAIIPAKQQGTLKASPLDVIADDDNDDEEEEDNELEKEDEEAQGRSKASSVFFLIFAGPSRILSTQSKGKTTGRKTKVQELPSAGGPLPPCDRCQAKNIECCPQFMKKHYVAQMACIWPGTQSATVASTTDTAPPAATVTTRSKTTRSKATGNTMVEKSNAKVNPIEEENDNFEMLDGTVDHWIEPGTNELPPPPPSPAMASEDDIQFSPLTVVHSTPTPAMPSGPGQPTLYPLSHDQMEAMLAQICLEMEELCIRDRLEIDFYAMSVQVDVIEWDMHMQCGLLSECTTKVRDIVRYLREQRSGQMTGLTPPPAFNPPPITVPGPSINVSWMSAQTSGDALGDTADGLLVARHNRVSFTPTNIPSLTMRQSKLSVPSVAGPSRAPADVQSISAPLQRPQFGPLSHQGRSWSD